MFSCFFTHPAPVLWRIRREERHPRTAQEGPSSEGEDDVAMGIDLVSPLRGPPLHWRHIQTMHDAQSHTTRTRMRTRQSPHPSPGSWPVNWGRHAEGTTSIHKTAGRHRLSRRRPERPRWGFLKGEPINPRPIALRLERDAQWLGKSRAVDKSLKSEEHGDMTAPRH